MKNTKEIIKKWYEKLAFPKEYDKEFYEALENTEISPDLTLDGYDKKCEDGRKNLLAFLYLAEELSEKYRERGIPDEILMDTLSDVVIWSNTWTKIKGTLHLAQLDWLEWHYRFRLFRLGRLQFFMRNIDEDVPEYGIKKGEQVLDMHSPEGGKLTPEECKNSLNLALEFFPKYFPNHKFVCFTCHSWLLDETLKKYFPENSNVVKFGDMFVRRHSQVRNALLGYMFTWDTTIENLKDRVPTGETARKIKDAVLSGEEFHVTFGIIPLKERY